MAVQTTDIEQVYEFWRARQPRPDRVRLTPTRRQVIRRALAVYPAEDLIWLIRFAYESSHQLAQWWRGNNPAKKTYLDLSELFRITKLDLRRDKADAWRLWLEEQGVESEAQLHQLQERAGNLVAFRRRRAG